MFSFLSPRKFLHGLLFFASVLSMSVTASAEIQTLNTSPMLMLRGDLEQGGIVFGQVRQGDRVLFKGKALSLTEDSTFVFGLDRDAPAKIQLKVIDKMGQEKPYDYSVKQREYDIQKIVGVDQKHVSPPKEVQERIAREAQMVKKTRAINDPRKDFLDDFIWPLKGRISGVYGSQRVYNGTPGNPHFGVDIVGPVGAPVRAPASGVITLAEPDLYFSGGTLVLDHGYGLSSTFIHLSKLLVKEGQRIERGQLIAEVGSTGRATGPHLDWRMNWFDTRVDPQLFMKNKPM